MAVYFFIPLNLRLLNLLASFGLNILLNFAHGSEGRKAYWHFNKRILNLNAVMKEVYMGTSLRVRVLGLIFLCDHI